MHISIKSVIIINLFFLQDGRTALQLALSLGGNASKLMFIIVIVNH